MSERRSSGDKGGRGAKKPFTRKPLGKKISDTKPGARRAYKSRDGESSKEREVNPEKGKFARKGYNRPEGAEERKPRKDDATERKPRTTGAGYDKGNFGERDKETGERKVRRPASDAGERKPRRDEDATGESIPYAERKHGDKRGYGKSTSGEKKGYGVKRYGSRDEKPAGERKPYSRDDKGAGERKPYGERKPFGERDKAERKPLGERKPYGERTKDERKPYSSERKPYGERRGSGESSSYKSRNTLRREKDMSEEGYSEKASPFEDKETLRLNKFIANAGICSRRQADDYIADGEVTVNGEVIREMGHRVKKTDDVKFKGKKVEYGRKVYILLNKPKDFLTTVTDDRERKTVMELIRGATDEKVFPVGRLDRNTTGLLLFTNDGELTQQLTHPSFGVTKVYHVSLDKPVAIEDMEKIAAGVELEDGLAEVDDIAYADAKDKSQVGIELHIGKNRIVRRIFETLGYDVRKLDRVLYAGISKKDLPRGKWRLLSEKEVIQLKKFNEKR